MKYAKFHSVTVNDDNGNEINVDLRFTALSELKLKKKYHKDGKDLFLSAFDDTELFLDILDESLKFSGNENTVKSGVELFERLADTDNLGIFARNLLILEIAAASGVLSEAEKNALKTAVEEERDGVINRKTRGGKISTAEATEKLKEINEKNA